MMRTWMAPLLLLLPGPCHLAQGQAAQAPKQPSATAPVRLGGRVGTVRSFVPAGYEVHTQQKADLNLDGRPDILLILNSKGESEQYWSDSSDSIKPRLLLVLTGTTGKQYQLQAKSATATYSYGYDGNFLDCLEEVKIRRGEFTLFHFGGRGTRWYRSITFTYQPATATWRLSADTEGSFAVMAPEHPHEENRLKRRVTLNRFNIYD